LEIAAAWVRRSGKPKRDRLDRADAVQPEYGIAVDRTPLL
jgi:hypothetical protein